MTSEWQRWKGIMKCYPFEEKRLAKWKAPYIVQPKYDGFRCRAIPLTIQTPQPGGGHLLLSSEENPVFSCPHINVELDRLGITGELDGELYCHGMSFEQISSIVSRSVNISTECTNIIYYVFDIVIDQPQMKRTLALENLRGMSSIIQVAPFYLCENLDDVMRTFDQMCELGYEGIIVRHNMAPYERRRSTWVMKFKPKKQDEYLVVGFQEEIDKEGMEKGSLGALICASGDGNTFNVGTGFSAEQRQIYWEMKEQLIGKTVVVKYQHITSGMKVPRFPVFVEVKDLL